MADGSVKIFPDSTGKAVDTETLTTDEGSVHRQRVKNYPATTATTLTSGIDAAANPTYIMGTNANRLGATIFNDSPSDFYVLVGTSGVDNGTTLEDVSPANFTVKMKQDDYYEIPYEYTGPVEGLWVTASGKAMITEFTEE